MRQPTPTAYSRIDEACRAPVRAEKIRGTDFWYVFCSFLGHRWFWEQYRQYWELVDEDKLGPAHRMRHKDALEVMKCIRSKAETTPLRKSELTFLGIVLSRKALKGLLWAHRRQLFAQNEPSKVAKPIWELIEKLTSPSLPKNPVPPKHKPEVLSYELPHPETGVVLHATSWEGRWMIYCDVPEEGITFWDPLSESWGSEVVPMTKDSILEELQDIPSPLERYLEIRGDMWSKSRQALKRSVKKELFEYLESSLQEMGFRTSDTLEVIFRKVGG